MKVHNLNSFCFWRLALLIVVFSSGNFVLSLHAQNEAATVKSTNLSQVTGRSPIANSSGVTIQQIHLSGKDQQTEVRVDGSGQLTYKAFLLNQPDRLVLDFSGAAVRVQ